METACAAIYAAARRSNSSRTHSIKTQPHDGHSDTQSQPSGEFALGADVSHLVTLALFCWFRLLLTVGFFAHRSHRSQIIAVVCKEIKFANENGE